ncbi:MAG TPA: plasmid pRiA4b ORF-3 family protein [Chloroflexota bacterium]|nr:plasmid pRiA4b ORF-3 family protein [Chloroflexota bacterium]
MAPVAKSESGQDSLIWQLKVTLTDAKPPIWRRIQVPGSISLYKLHQIIQTIMPWQGYHLYEFQVGELTFGDPDPEDAFYEREVKSARRATLSQALPEPKAKLLYVYDFGDNWEHAVVVEKILPPEPSVRYPVCLKGVRAAPPEDVGGVSGYEDFLAAVRDPTHEEHEHMLEWAGGTWDAERFDLAAVNAALRRPRRRGRYEE